jgi:hypothetical protein
MSNDKVCELTLHYSKPIGTFAAGAVYFRINYNIKGPDGTYFGSGTTPIADKNDKKNIPAALSAEMDKISERVPGVVFRLKNCTPDGMERIRVFFPDLAYALPDREFQAISDELRKQRADLL